MNTVNEYPTEKYEPLEDLISFRGFDYRAYHTGEKEILQPQLEVLGYVKVEWLPGETDSFGPLTRVCKATDRNGKVTWFMYG